MEGFVEAAWVCILEIQLVLVFMTSGSSVLTTSDTWTIRGSTSNVDGSGDIPFEADIPKPATRTDPLVDSYDQGYMVQTVTTHSLSNITSQTLDNSTFVTSVYNHLNISNTNRVDIHNLTLAAQMLEPTSAPSDLVEQNLTLRNTSGFTPYIFNDKMPKRSHNPKGGHRSHKHRSRPKAPHFALPGKAGVGHLDDWSHENRSRNSSNPHKHRGKGHATWKKKFHHYKVLYDTLRARDEKRRNQTEFYAWIFGATMLVLATVSTAVSCFVFCFCGGEKWHHPKRLRVDAAGDYHRVESVSSFVEHGESSHPGDHVTVI